MKKFKLLLLLFSVVLLFPAAVAAQDNGAAGVSYRSYVKSQGLQDYVSNGAVSGTTGQALPIFQIAAHLDNVANYGVSYNAFVVGSGWQVPQRDGTLIGNPEAQTIIEQIQFKLDPEVEGTYNIFYRAHVSDIGWTGWGSNGASVGSSGDNKQIEAYEMVILPKDQPAPGDINNSLVIITVKHRTIREFLETALQPVGSTLYVFGGGWNREDTGAGMPARTIGVSPLWKEFFDTKDAGYNYRDYMNGNKPNPDMIDYGLDCSGYVGWSVYNILNDQNGGPGEVYYADEEAEIYAQKGYGTYTPYGQVRNFQAGDIVSLEEDGHVYMAVGQCPDGSVVLMHASPPGVMISGTTSQTGGETQATTLAKSFMQSYYPEYYNRYANQLNRGRFYTTRCSKMSWSPNVLSDPEGLRNMNAEQILNILFQ